MAKGERITISPDTKKSLGKIAKPFEKFDDCIKRVLDCVCQQEIEKSENTKESEQ